MDDLSYLADLSETEFEIERCRLINEELNKVPKHLRTKLLEYQFVLDVRREKLSPTEFLTSLVSDMSENVENLSDQFVSIQNTLIKK